MGNGRRTATGKFFGDVIMEIKLKLLSDNHNSYANGYLTITVQSDSVWFKIDDYEREVSVDKRELAKVLSLLKD